MILVYPVRVSLLASLPSPGDLVELPFMRTALIELALLGIAGGLLGVRQRLLRIVLAHEDADYEAPSRLQAIARTDPRSDMCDAR